MNHYPHHIGDYAEATAHLSFVEDAAYSRMIRKYYSTEKPLPADVKAVQRLVGARTKDELRAVEVILQEFFILQDDGWHQPRCDAELTRYFEKSDKASASANSRWKASGRNANAMRTHKYPNANAHANASKTHDERNANQEPRTKNQEPREDQKQRSPSGSRLAIEALPGDWREYCKTERPELNPERVFIDFRDYWVAKPGKDGRKADWGATWRSWVRKEGQFTKPASRPAESLYERNLRAVGIDPG